MISDIVFAKLQLFLPHDRVADVSGRDIQLQAADCLQIQLQCNGAALRCPDVFNPVSDLHDCQQMKPS